MTNFRTAQLRNGHTFVSQKGLERKLHAVRSKEIGGMELVVFRQVRLPCFSSTIIAASMYLSAKVESPRAVVLSSASCNCSGVCFDFCIEVFPYGLSIPSAEKQTVERELGLQDSLF